MDKININGLTQGCTAEQLNAIAMNILHRKGDVEMSGCNVTVTPPSGMDAFMAGIIVKCAEESGGTVNISGHTEIDDDDWAYIQRYGMYDWMKQAMDDFEIPFSSLRTDEILQGFPTYNGTQNGNYTLWKAKLNISTLPTNWATQKYSYYESWDDNTNGVSTFSNNCIFSKFVRFTKLPTKLRVYIDDYFYLYINGTLVFTAEKCQNSTVGIDISSYVNVDEVAHVTALASSYIAPNYAYFGFVE